MSLRELSTPVAAVAVALALLAAAEGTARWWEKRPEIDPARIEARAPGPKPAGSFRLFVHGESIAKGRPVRELAFVAQLEYWLQRSLPERRIEVHNFAIPGMPSRRVALGVAAAIDWAPDLLLVMTGGNEFLRRDDDLDPRAADEGRALQRLLRRSSLLRAARRLAHRVRRATGQVTVAEHLPWSPDSAAYRRKLDGFERNLEAILGVATDAGVPVLLATLPSNQADWPPSNRYFADRIYGKDFVSTLDRIAAQLAEGRHEPARRAIDAGLARYRDDALLLYLQGRSEVLEGRPGRARALFRRARDRDPTPWRVTSALNDAIRRAARRPGVHLVDVEDALEARARDGLVGFDLVVDNSHLTPEGNALVTREVMQTLARSGHLVTRNAAYFREDDPLATFVAHAREAAAGRDLDAEYYRGAGLSCVKAPYQHYGIARGYLERWRDRAPEDWRPWANLASVSLLEGDREAGLAELEIARRLRRAGHPLVDEDETPFLAEALEANGLPATSLGAGS